MGARFSGNRNGPSGDSVRSRSWHNVREKVDAAREARTNGDFGEAARCFEEAAEASIYNREVAGIAGAHYLEAANCAETVVERRDTSGSVNATNSKPSAGRSTVSVASVASGDLTGIENVLRLLDKSATQYSTGNRPNRAANVRKRMAMLYDGTLQNSNSAVKYYEMASRDYEAANMFHNAIDCDLKGADVAYKSNPLLSLEKLEKAAEKYIKRGDFVSASPVIYKIVLITGSVYDVQRAKSARDSYVRIHRLLNLNVDLRRLSLFFDALEESDTEMVNSLIEEARDPWAKDVMMEMKNDYFLEDEADIK